jgi:restriction endonuclease-like protein
MKSTGIGIDDVRQGRENRADRLPFACYVDQTSRRAREVPANQHGFSSDAHGRPSHAPARGSRGTEEEAVSDPYEQNKQEAELLEALYPVTVVVNFALRKRPGIPPKTYRRQADPDAAVGCVLCVKNRPQSFHGRRVGVMTNGKAIWYAVELGLDALHKYAEGMSAVILTCMSTSIQNLEKKEGRRLWIREDRADVMVRVLGKMGSSRLVFKNKRNDQERYDLAHWAAERSLLEDEVSIPDSSEMSELAARAADASIDDSEMEAKLLEELVRFFPEGCLYEGRYPARRGVHGFLVPQFWVEAGSRHNAEFGVFAPKRYRLDFAIITQRQKLCVEVDGKHHQEPKQKADDQQRDRDVRGIGWKVLRIPGTDIFKNANECARCVIAAIG